MDGLKKMENTITCVRCDAQGCSVLERPVILSFSSCCALDSTLSKRLFGQQLGGSIPIAGHNRSRLWGISIGVVSNDKVRAVNTIRYCATNNLAKVYIDR